jgi:hypothetical protein
LEFRYAKLHLKHINTVIHGGGDVGMKFYEIDNALKEAIKAGDKPLRIWIQIELP